ncbi:HlyD family efflux transporter periplasmic adaptor subunit [Lignipirellula cremea]|uniref:Peptidase family M50 n=1 Tax=Lignipirellula cremea TaxID=2528010 RepID=A0A518E4L7_9BACT|nr:HlyD family efflux transporter periplasmic adaptor subunit [Lignipirellula cremea]QDU99024.1 Peptidase family M50 [Lignipirellula cremea]
MPVQSDPSVREFGSTRLRLRSDLIFTPQLTGDRPYYLVEDPLNSRFFRLGHVEYTLVTLLDGQTTIHDALSHLSTVLPHHQLTEADAAAHCRWLVAMDLAHTEESAQAARLAGSAQTAARQKTLAQWNPISFRLPLGRPDPMFTRLAGALGWLYSPAATAVGLLLAAVGGFLVCSRWEAFVASSQGVFAPGNWIWMVVCWVLLKIVHEISHGVVCKRYGGTVRETGVQFILLAPLAYVDVTSSWRFRSRWRRIHVAAAGMYSELVIAGIAALAWSQTGDGWLGNFCFNLILMASVTTLLFNANPLMKFDGYYMLSDALSLPNLYGNGQACLRYAACRYLLGMPAALPDWTPRESTIFHLYGWAAFAWRIVISVTMIVTAAALFHGAGVLLACLAGVLWLGLPAFHFVKFLATDEGGPQPQRLRFLLIASLATAMAVGIFGFVPWPGTIAAPGVVDYSPPQLIRASSAGFVQSIHVQSGQQVQPGELLVVLENRELVRELADLQLQIRQSELRGRQREQKGELAAEQAEEKQAEALRSQLAEKQIQVERLTVRAPCAGQVIGRNLDALQGKFLEEGDELFSLGDEAHKELRISIAQDDLEVFHHQVQQPVRIDVPGLALWRSPLEKVIPRATLTPPHPAFAAAHGGPLPVKPTAARSDGSPQDAYELLEPRFTATVRLTPAESRQLRTGQRVVVSHRALHESIGQHLYHAAAAWIRERLAS